MTYDKRYNLPLMLVGLTLAAGCSQRTSHRLPGFETSRHWAEQTRELTYEPGVRIHLNAPAESAFDPRKPTQLVLYALPNGNSIEWTIGRQEAEGLDWHYYIQHIGAQTRRLREVIDDHNLVVAYLEADQKSWPHWRRTHENAGQLITGLIAHLEKQIDVADLTVVLSGHSGGGSFIFGYLNGLERIGNDVERIAFLDSNYGFSVEAGHGTKLLDWLNRSPEHQLTVLAYDDREITFNGKKVVGPTGGTYRASHRMLDRFRQDVALTETAGAGWIRYRGLNGQLDIIIHRNPENRILHTVLVGDMNGFIHAQTSGTNYEERAGTFGGPAAYENWIQPD
ncbi:MAG: hypothetical protein GY778_32330 [bacterium]|nr:hypothetical protein [bacterium]